jgi:2-polyprenyl-3-methyl-5-hydroxy-6-metoxy-1,4-benzoquinol methylase
MIQYIHYSACPICRSNELRQVLEAKDYTVSGEKFQIVECVTCSLRLTQDVPDAESIGPYYKAEDYISHTNTSKGLINRIYLSVRTRTLTAKRKLVENYTKRSNGDILDYGSGVGSFVNEMKKNGWSTTGLEPDPDARARAKHLYGIDILPSDSMAGVTTESVDAITLWHVLEHVHELNNCIQELKRVLKADGRIFIAVPNYTSHDAGVYKEFWAAYDVPRHLYHFSPRSMEKLMQAHGLKIVAHKQMWYDSFYISLLSSKYKNGSSNWLGAFWNGLVSNMKALSNARKCCSVIYVIGK